MNLVSTWKPTETYPVSCWANRSPRPQYSKSASSRIELRSTLNQPSTHVFPTTVLWCPVPTQTPGTYIDPKSYLLSTDLNSSPHRQRSTTDHVATIRGPPTCASAKTPLLLPHGVSSKYAPLPLDVFPTYATTRVPPPVDLPPDSSLLCSDLSFLTYT